MLEIQKVFKKANDWRNIGTGTNGSWVRKNTKKPLELSRGFQHMRKIIENYGGIILS